MTLFYKNPEDVEESEDDSDVVNVNEVCQHCGNESGYTLIGKVGAAEEPAEETPEEATDGELAADEGTIEDTSDEIASEENAEEATEGTGEEDFDLDELDLEIEDDETETAKEESFENAGGDSYLVEELLEEAPDLEVSASEFEELINSPEFKKPISDKTAQAMLDRLSGDEPVDEDLDLEEDEESLNEGSLGLLGKTLAKKAKQVGSNIKAKASAAIDKFADNTKTREEKADFILNYYLNDNIQEVEVGEDGKIYVDDADRRFEVFLVVGAKGTFSNGRPITGPVSPKNTDIIIGMSEPQERSAYKEADELAKGWSGMKGNGPAFIYLAKNKDDQKALFLCEYYKGELVDSKDNLEKLFELVKKDLESKDHIRRGGGVEGNDPSEPQVKEIPASGLKKGNKIVLDNEVFEVQEVAKSRFGADNLALQIKGEDGKIEPISVGADAKVSILVEALATEAVEKTDTDYLAKLIENFDEIDDVNLEKVIAESLVSEYQNVDTFKLASCDFKDGKLLVEGTILFKSGAERATTYTFTDGHIDRHGKVEMIGLNEKLGTNNFRLFGCADNNQTKTLMIESLAKDI